MEGDGTLLHTIGLMVAAGLFAHEVGRRTGLPRVTLLLLLGVLSGPHVLGFIGEDFDEAHTVATNIALTMVGFLLGEQFTLRWVRENGKRIFGLSAAITITTALAVFAAMLLATGDAHLAAVLAAIATATGPASTVEEIRDAHSGGPLTRAVLPLVAVNDVWAVLLFSLALAYVGVSTEAGEAHLALLDGVQEIAGAVLLGVVLGLVVSQLTGRLSEGEPTLLEAIAMVLITAGLALALDVSLILTAVTLGIVVANFARHHERPFHEIRDIEAPFLAVFFFLAGASLEFDALTGVLALALVYTISRVAGRVGGSFLGGRVMRTKGPVERWLGVTMLPQAGVALGLALLVSERYPDLASEVIPIVVATTVLFELSGPLLLRLSLSRAGEVGQGGDTWDSA